MMIIHVDGVRVCIENYQPFVQGTVGLQANVQLSEEWDGLTVTAVFATADNFDTRYPVSAGSGTITIPWEVLSEARAHPLLSFDGRDSGGNLIRRSSICDLGEVAPSLDPLGETPTPTPPYPDWYENVFEAGQQALQSAQDAEAYAKGTRGGIEVGTTDPTYHSNAKYFKEQAEAIKDSIPEDYTKLVGEVGELKSSINQIYPVNVDVGETTAGYYIYLNGQPMGDDPNSSVTDFVPVLPGHSIYVSNIYCTGNRCVCAYDENKTFTRVLTSNTGNTPINATLRRNEYYIRITVWKTNVPSVVYTDELALTDIAYLENRDATIETHFDREITEYQVLRGFYVASDGSYVGDDNSAIIDKIPIQSGKSFTVKDVVLAGSRSICAYDSNGDFVSVLDTNQGLTAKTFTYTNDGSYAYVSITQTISIRSEMPTIEYVDGFSEISDEAIGEKRSIFDSDFIPFWNGQVETGYVDFNGTSVVASGAYRHTPFIPVTGGRTIIIKNFCSAVVRYLFAYDENKNVLYIPVASSSASVSSYEYQIPYDVYFIRYNLYTDQVNTTSIEYKDTDVYKWSKEVYYASIVEKWFRKTDNKISTPFAEATAQPTITLIDDDTISVEAVQRYYNACVANDVKGGYAVLTANLENNTALKNLLLDYESAGFSMNIHAYSQVDAFNSGATRDIEVAEANFCKGLRQMREFGFLDYKYWCTPYGVSDTDIQDLAKRHGIKCLIRSGINNAFVGTGPLSRFDIPRASLNNDDTALGEVKDLVDRIVPVNGWLLVTTHMAENSWASDTSRFTDFVTYAKNNGCVFKTISEAWAERQYIFDLYSTL